MTSPDRIPVAPAVMEWARRTSGQGVDEAARRIGVSQNTLEKWESGDTLPTIKQLRKAASCYKRPLAVLLLPTPPREFSALRDFRTIRFTERADWSPALHAEYRRALGQREVFEELSEISASSLAQTASLPEITQGTPAEEAGLKLRQFLGLGESVIVTWNNQFEALNYHIALTEERGILVIHTRDIEISEMRGFSISEWPYPVIALNGKDFPRPRLFTLFHELCHLALNAGGMCDLHETRREQNRYEDQVERYCNQVAASALMPRESFLNTPLLQTRPPQHQWTLTELRQLGDSFGVSGEAALLRLVGLRLASWDFYRLKKSELDEEYERARDELKEKQRASTGGPSFYVVKARDLGRGYIASVLDAFQSRAISPVDAAEYLDVKYDQIDKLGKEVH